MHQNKRIIMWLNNEFGVGNENVQIVKRALEKEVPQKIHSICRNENTIGGYCPNCNGTVRIEDTFLTRAKGQCCSWCGQKLDWETEC